MIFLTFWIKIILWFHSWDLVSWHIELWLAFTALNVGRYSSVDFQCPWLQMDLRSSALSVFSPWLFSNSALSLQYYTDLLWKSWCAFHFICIVSYSICFLNKKFLQGSGNFSRIISDSWHWVWEVHGHACILDLLTLSSKFLNFSSHTSQIFLLACHLVH